MKKVHLNVEMMKNKNLISLLNLNRKTINLMFFLIVYKEKNIKRSVIKISKIHLIMEFISKCM